MNKLAALAIVLSCAGSAAQQSSSAPAPYARIEEGQTARCAAPEGCVVTSTILQANVLRQAFEAGRASCRGTL